MIVATSLRSLLRRPGRTGLALAGIAVSAALLLDMTLLAGGLTRSFGQLLGAQGYALRVTPRGTLPFDTEAAIAEAGSVAARLREVPGVKAVTPVLAGQFFLVDGDSAAEPVLALGVEPGTGFQYRLTGGAEPDVGEVVLSEPLARALDAAPGDTVGLAAAAEVSLGRARGIRRYVVSGVGDFLYDYADQRTVAMPLAEVQAATRRPDHVSLFGVAAAAVPDDTLAARIEAAVPEVSALSTGTLMREMDRRLLYFRQLAAILGSIAVAVTALLVATIVTIGVRERFGEIATLRAMGVRRLRILLAIVAEGLALAVAGCALGFPLGAWLAGRLDRILLAFPGIPARVTFFAWEPTRVALAFGIVLAAAALSGLVPALHATRAPLAAVLREEAE